MEPILKKALISLGNGYETGAMHRGDVEAVISAELRSVSFGDGHHGRSSADDWLFAPGHASGEIKYVA